MELGVYPLRALEEQRVKYVHMCFEYYMAFFRKHVVLANILIRFYNLTISLNFVTHPLDKRSSFFPKK